MNPNENVDKSAAVEAFNAGVAAAKEEKFEDAAKAWRKALEHDRMLAPAARNLAIFSEDAGDNESAAAYWAMLLDIEPADTEALVRRAGALTRLGRLDDAIAAYERAIEVHPWYRFWYEELGRVLMNAGREAEAEEWRNRASKLDADEAELAFEDGMRQLQEDNLPLAIACFEAILEDLPDYIDARLMLANALEKADRGTEAREHLNAALKSAKAAKPVVLYRRALFHLRAGDLSEAINDLDSAVKAEPNYGRASRLRTELRAELARLSTNGSGLHALSKG